MKKIVLSFLVISSILITGFTAFAAEIPIKKIIPVSNDYIMILAENGDLYCADSIYSSTKELVKTNVMDFFMTDYIMSEYKGYTNDNKIFTFKDSYDLGLHKHIGGITEEKEGNVKTPIKLGVPSYIDTSNNLIVADIIVMKNVLKSEGAYILTTDGNLYSYHDTFWRYTDCEPEPKFLMSEVKDFTDDVILKTNGDLYLKDGDNINKVLSNVDNLSRHFNSYIVDTSNNLYSIGYKNGVVTTNLVSQNIKDIYDDNNLYTLDIYGNLYKHFYDGAQRQVNEEGQKIGSVVNIRKKIYLDDNGFLLKDFSPVYEIGKIRSVLEIDGYVYINEAGEVWHSDNKMTTFEKLQLSEKSTVLNINGEECKLENNIKVIDGRTMYPFRECLNLIGANVYWDGENQIAIGEVQGIKIEFPIGKNEYYINGIKHEMDTAAYIDTAIGRTYIPIRYAAEGLGYTVDWIEGKIENTIKIYK